MSVKQPMWEKTTNTTPSDWVVPGVSWPDNSQWGGFYDEMKKYVYPSYPTYPAPAAPKTPEEMGTQIAEMQRRMLAMQRELAAKKLVSELDSDQLTALLNDERRLGMLKDYLKQLFMAHEIEEAL